MTAAAQKPTLISPEAAAKRLGFTTEHTRRLLRAGKIPGLRIGGRWRVDVEQLEKWIEQRTTEHTEHQAEAKG